MEDLPSSWGRMPSYLITVLVKKEVEAQDVAVLKRRFNDELRPELEALGYGVRLEDVEPVTESGE